MTKTECTVWLEAAVNDGWVCDRLYKDEDVETYAVLSRDGWKAYVDRRDYPNHIDEQQRKDRGEITVWAPDRLQVTVPIIYSFGELVNGLRYCKYCGVNNTETTRISFAGRCCLKCRPELAKTMESAGWCD